MRIGGLRASEEGMGAGLCWPSFNSRGCLLPAKGRAGCDGGVYSGEITASVAL